MVTDPVCLTQLDEDEAVDKTEYNGQTYYFHSDRCKEVFDQDPAEYAGRLAESVYGDQGHRFPE